MSIQKQFGFFAFGAALVVAGCGSGVKPADEPAVSSVKKVNWSPKSDAGLPVTQDADPAEFQKVVVMNSGRFGAGRRDPFALTSRETQFDRAQASERVFSQVGGFSTDVEPKQEVAPTLAVEPQPYRRLSGIVVGDSVIAIMEMGNGRPPEVIRPGMKIPNTDWTVISIDQDKATLRRGGSVLPHQIEVRLETPPPGYGPAAPTSGFTPGAGAPGGPANGRPGGPRSGKGLGGGSGSSAD